MIIEVVKRNGKFLNPKIVGGDIYREEKFTQVFPELYDLIKHEFDYNNEYETVSTAGFLPVSQGEYSN